MLIAYVISLGFSLWYGSLMASNRRLEQFLLPLLDVLQSVPILSFLPVVLLGLSAFLSQTAASEIASVVLIFTSQAWNLAFGWYQAQKTIPQELQEAAANFQFSPWLRFRTVELPFGALTLVWNSVMSWAGGWFFLMAAEIFTVGNKDFRLPGLGAYLSQAANAGDVKAITWGLSTLLFMIVALDQLLWRPLLAWSDRFKLETVETDQPRPRSWFLEAWRRSRIVSDWIQTLLKRMFAPVEARIERTFVFQPNAETASQQSTWSTFFMAAGGLIILYGVYRAGALFFQVSGGDWKLIMEGMLATGLRVLVAMVIALAWTIPFRCRHRHEFSNYEMGSADRANRCVCSCNSAVSGPDVRPGQFDGWSQFHRRSTDADGNPVVSAVQYHCRSDGNTAGSAPHGVGARTERLATLARSGFSWRSSLTS